MGKNKKIIVCSDGTGNKTNKGRGTNVFKIFEAIDNSGHHHDQKFERQIAFYDDGVGTSKFAPLRMLSGAFGLGVARNVRQLYRQLSRSYNRGDKIYMFGFSRGAYTVRTLASIIIECGLVDMDSKQKIKWLPFLKPGSNAWLNWISWRAWRTHRRQFKSVLGYLVEFLIVGKPENATQEFRTAYSIDRESEEGQIRIHFLGVWDTVGSVGLPFDFLTWFVNTFLYRFSFPNRELNTRVEKACQALAIDEERASFKPILWRETDRDEMPEGSGLRERITKLWGDVLMKNKKLSASNKYNYAQVCECKAISLKEPEDDSAQKNAEKPTSLVEPEPRIEQVWFPGVHSDVGGGYPKQGLSYITLDWMMEKAFASGLIFSEGARESVKAQRNAFDKLHDSRAGLGTVYRYSPRNVSRLCYENHAEQRIHGTIFERISDENNYRPCPVSRDAQVVKTPHEKYRDIDTTQAQIKTATEPKSLGFLIGTRVTLHWILIALIIGVLYLAQLEVGGPLELIKGLYNTMDTPFAAIKTYFLIPLAANDFYWAKIVGGVLLGLLTFSFLVRQLMGGVRSKFWDDIFS